MALVDLGQLLGLLPLLLDRLEDPDEAQRQHLTPAASELRALATRYAPTIAFLRAEPARRKEEDAS